MPRITVVEKALRGYYGYAYPDTGEIEIASGLHDYCYMVTLIHEVLHILYPDASETEVNRNSRTIAHQLRKAGYRSHRPKRKASAPPLES